MKKIAIGIITASLALFVAGCSSNTPEAAPAPAPVNTAPAVPYDPPVYSEKDARQQAFLTLIQEEFPTVDDATALSLGNAICNAIGNGATLLEVGQVIVNNGFSSSEAGTIVGLSIGGLCPEYQYLVDQLSG